MSSKDEVVKSVPQNGFVGHPKGLFTLFFTEFWERFSYYGMRAILIFFMYYELHEGGLGLDRGTANSIMAIYGSLVYMSGIIGGWIADRVLGTRKPFLWWRVNNDWSLTASIAWWCEHVICFDGIYRYGYWFIKAKRFKYCWGHLC